MVELRISYIQMRSVEVTTHANATEARREVLGFAIANKLKIKPTAGGVYGDLHDNMGRAGSFKIEEF